MAKIPDSFLQELKDRINIEDYILRNLQLKRTGSNIVGLCPFHSEKTPSFTVFPDTQSFYCFGCGAGGDIISYVMRMENLDYLEAIRLLAEYAGLTVPETDDDRQNSVQRARIIEMNKKAAGFFHKCLYDPKAKVAQEYVKKRGLLQKTIRHFGIGFAPDSWSDLRDYLKSQGFSENEMVAGGLAVKNTEKNSVYDKFRNRLMFPIIDLRGNVIGFGGRVLDDSKPKYLNSPDTLAFKKSLNLFALNFAKNSPAGKLILCEGYMDVISMHQAGFDYAVATLGTAITKEQARLISRYSKEVVLAYDADGAGQAATNKAITLLNEVGVNVKVLSIVGGKDPDEFIRTFGAERFKNLLEGSGGHIDFKIQKLLSKYNLDSADDTVYFIKDAANVISQVYNAIEREVYINKIAKQTNISASAISAEVNRLLKINAQKSRKNEFKTQNEMLLGIKDRVNPEKSTHLKAARAEEELIGVIYKNPDFLSTVQQNISAGEFVTEFNRRLFEYIVARIETGQALDLTFFSKDFTSDEMSRITAIIVKSNLNINFDRSIVSELSDVIKTENEKIRAQNLKEVSNDELLKMMKDLQKRKGE
ncbi:MAG: DNA primase [Ruminococcaceae bacterium]|nr:DNA primase [Oscillospiraceae bacterium]